MPISGFRIFFLISLLKPTIPLFKVPASAKWLHLHLWLRYTTGTTRLFRTVKNGFKKEPGIRVIIPHLGGLNGGYRTIAKAGLWQRPNVWADTALASADEIRDYIQNYGHERLMFGSDFPFGDPASELGKITRMQLDKHVEEAVLSGNLVRLLSDSNL